MKFKHFHNILFITLWTLILSGSLLWNIDRVNKTVVELATLTANASYEKDILYRRWNANHGGVYARPNEASPPNKYLKPEKRSILTINGETLIMLNPAYMARQVFELMKDQTGVKSRITSIKPINPSNTPDSWEIQALNRLDSGEKEIIEIVSENETNTLRFIKPLMTEKPCLSCHAENGYKEGDLRGGLSVTVPLEPYQKSGNSHIQVLIFGHIITWVLGIIGITFGTNKYNSFIKKEKEAELTQKENETLQLVMNGVAESIVLIGSDYQVKLCNPSARDFYSDEKMYEGNTCYNAIHGLKLPCNHNSEEPCPLHATQDIKKPFNMVYEKEDSKGQKRVIEVLATPIWHSDGNFKGIIKVDRDITERVKAEKELKHLAAHDSLTGLPNRAFFESEFSKAILHGESNNHKVALLFIDLDRFKNINDTLGHNTGDRVLIEISRRLKACMDGNGIVARFGGDEFTILIKQFNDIGILSEIAQKIINTITEPLPIDGYNFYISASIGISISTIDGNDTVTLLKSADTALYKAKNLGRGNYQFHERLRENTILKSLRLESALKIALDTDMIHPVYQPLVKSDSGNIIGMEVLARWNHKEQGNISPADFIPVAEESGLIVQLGNQILRKACLQCKVWNENFNKNLAVKVNVSPRQFMREDIIKTVSEVLRETKLSPEFLELEITESSIMANLDIAIETLKKLRDMGIGVALDDFGTGYSSLSYLKALPITTLKIDKSFVFDMWKDQRDSIFVKTIINLAHNLKIKVIAEGVETEEQKKMLQEYECDYLQGFLFSKPLPAPQFELSYLSKEDFYFFQMNNNPLLHVLNFFQSATKGLF